MSTDTNPTLTDQIYWASQPPAVQALQQFSGVARAKQAMALAAEGYTIDVAIMANGWDAVKTMQLRQSYGYTWVPSALQPAVLVPPGLSFPGFPNYDASVIPSGSIKVSLDAADYPPFSGQISPTNATAAYVVMVGPQVGPNRYVCLPGDTVPAGVTVQFNGAFYLKHADGTNTPFGYEYDRYYTAVSQ